MSVIIKGMDMPKKCYDCVFEEKGWCCAVNGIRRVESIDRPDWCPLEEAEPVKHGRWLIGVGENGEPIGTYCSECGWSWEKGVAAVNLNKVLSLIKTPRCPWCGAIMEEEKPDGD